MSEFTISEQMRAWGKAHGWNVDEYADWFTDYLANRTKKYKDNDAAFRNCVRSDWPGFRRGKPQWVQSVSGDLKVTVRDNYIRPPEGIPMPPNLTRWTK